MIQATRRIQRWPFKKRDDGIIAVTLDNNVWDFLHARNLDLSRELPAEEFAVSITREVEIETRAIPADKKAELSEFINRTLQATNIKTTYVFGFAEANGTGPIRVGGFGQGVWQSKTEGEYYEEVRRLNLIKSKVMGSQLFYNEADSAVGAKSFFSVVLTCEAPSNSTPLTVAEQNGGAVLRLDKFDQSGLTLREYIQTYYNQL